MFDQTRSTPSNTEQQLAAVVQAGMQQLPEPERATLILADCYGLAYDEIARRTRASRGTVQARLARARSSLRDYMLKHQHTLPAEYHFASTPSPSSGSSSRITPRLRET